MRLALCGAFVGWVTVAGCGARTPLPGQAFGRGGDSIGDGSAGDGGGAALPYPNICPLTPPAEGDSCNLIYMPSYYPYRDCAGDIACFYVQGDKVVELACRNPDDACPGPYGDQPSSGTWAIWGHYKGSTTCAYVTPDQALDDDQEECVEVEGAVCCFTTKRENDNDVPFSLCGHC